MKSRGVIFHGSNSASNLETAFKLVFDHMKLDSESEKFVLSNSHPNFFMLRKEDDKNEISIEDARRLIEFLSQRPTLSGNRAVIIQNFENMSRNAANSILKILEEPPLDSVIILTTCKFLTILPTIRSRCLKIRVNDEKQEISKFNDPLEYLIKSLKNIESNFIVSSLDFIKSNCSNMLNFAKINSESFGNFLEVAIAYCGYMASKNADLNYANKVLSLQNLYSLSKNTYPDKQSIIVAAASILN